MVPEDIAKSMAYMAVKHVSNSAIIGLGSGSTLSVLVDALAEHVRKNRLDVMVIPTSLQIKFRAEMLGLRIADDSLIPLTDIVFDGADQIDKRFNMIKGGGGALLREKVLMHAARKAVILADESKYVDVLSRAVPIEVLPYARAFVVERLKAMGAEPVVRSLEKGYPFITENGNLILDTDLGRIEDPASKESELKCIPGVMDVGIFSKHASRYYKARRDGVIEVLEPER